MSQDTNDKKNKPDDDILDALKSAYADSTIAQPEDSQQAAWTAIGGYRIVRKIAEGGMGTVFEARQETPRRAVALKVMKEGIASRSALRRFEYEAQVLARLRHPNIAQIHHAGTHRQQDKSSPFFVMEYIPNARPITEHAKEKGLNTRERLLLFTQVTAAAHHGHQKGIIHRDFKPSNILVDSHGQVKIIDFGVARATDSDMAITTLQTDVGQLIGTLQYMSPEQCDADPHDLDVRSDIYALGVVLYELLCDQLPYDVRAVAIHEAARIIREQEPTRLSTVNRLLRGDIETIALKALEKNRMRRYQSADDLGDDIRSYLAGEPVSARPPSVIYQIRIFARKNRAVFGAIAAAFVIVTAAAIFSSWQFYRADAERENAIAGWREADLQREKADRESTKAIEAAAQAQTARGEAESQKTIAIEETQRGKLRLADSMVAEGDWLTSRRRFRAAKQRYAEALQIYDEFGHSTLRADLGLLDLYQVSPSPIANLPFTGYGVALSPDSRLAITGTGSGEVRIWEIMTGRTVHTLYGHQGRSRGIGFSADGRRVLSASNAGEVLLWDLDREAVAHQLAKQFSGIRSLGISSDRRQFWALCKDNVVRVWEINKGRIEREVQLDSPTESVLRLSDDGRFFAASPSKTSPRPSNRLLIFDSASGAHLKDADISHIDPITSAAFSPDGRLLLTGDWDGTVRLWDTETWQHQGSYTEHIGIITGLAFLPDSLGFVVADQDQSISLWVRRGSDWSVIRRFTEHEGTVDEIAVSDDGAVAVSVCTQGSNILIWNLQEQTGVEQIPATMLSSDGTLAYGLGAVIDVATGNVLRDFGPSAGAASFTPDLRGLVIHTEFGAELRDTNTGVVLTRFPRADLASEPMKFALGGLVGASFLQDDSVAVWDVATGELLFSKMLEKKEMCRRSMAFSPDARRIVVLDSYGFVSAWDIAENSRRYEYRLIDSSGNARYVDIDSSWTGSFSIVSSSLDRSAYLLGADGNDVICTLEGHTRGLFAAAIAESARLGMTSSFDRAIRLWDLRNAKEIRESSLPGEERPRHIELASDGTLALLSNDRTQMPQGRLWSLRWHSKYRELITKLPALLRGERGPDINDSDFATLGAWYAFRGAWQFALESMEHAKMYGADVSNLALARCSWITEHPEKAHDYFRKALERSEAPQEYLALCIKATAPGFDPVVISDSPLDSQNASGDPTRDSEDPRQQAQFGELCASWRRWREALGSLQYAEQNGIDISPLSLGRCLWALDNSESATVAFEKAISVGEADEFYLRLCLRAIQCKMRDCHEMEPIVLNESRIQAAIQASDTSSLRHLTGRHVVVEGIVESAKWDLREDEFEIRLVDSPLRAVIFARSRSLFADGLSKKTGDRMSDASVRIAGALGEYRQSPEIILDRPDQLQFLPKDTESPSQFARETMKSEEIVRWDQASNYLGETITVEGKVVHTKRTRKWCFLNFAEDWIGTFTVTIPSRVFRSWPESPENYFRGAVIRVSGTVTHHKGSPQVLVQNGEQIEILAKGKGESGSVAGESEGSTQESESHRVAEEVVCSEIIDGRTFRTQDGRVVRLLGTWWASRAHEKAKQEAAGRFLQSVIDGREVQISFENDNRRTDSSGRLLAYVYVGDVFVNEKLIREGYADVYTRGKFEHQDEWAKLRDESKSAKRGLWGME